MQRIFNKINITYVILVLIIALGLFLRVYRLEEVPPAISWDEAAVGYNAYTIANWGRDEFGNFFPITFKSFGDDKSPVHIYSTAIFVKLLGLSEFSIRFAAGFFGLLSIFLIYFCGKLLFNESTHDHTIGVSSCWHNSKVVGLLAAFVLAISPYNLQFSRFNHEANFALGFFLLGLSLFLLAVKEKRGWLLPFSILGFGLSLMSYHSAKVVVPVFLALLLGIYIKELWKLKIYTFLGFLVIGFFVSLYILNPSLLGVERMRQSSIPENIYWQTVIYQKTHNLLLAKVQVAWERYLVYFDRDFLFETGDNIERHATGKIGQFYKVDFIILVIGLIGLIWFLIKKRSREAFILLSWAVLAPVPAAIAGGLSETGHAARALFMMGSWHLIIAFGIYTILQFAKKTSFKIAVLMIVIILYVIAFKPYIIDYYSEYSIRSANEWQYGMEQIVDYVKQNPQFNLVYTTDIRSQPYIFFLFYLKQPLPSYLREIELNPTEQRLHSLVYSFDKYHFGDWDQIQSYPTKGVLYVIEPSVYDGLLHKKDFNIKKLIKYPNGNEAFYIISGEL